MVSDLTGMDIANASLLDEATAAAEAMTLAKRVTKSSSNIFYVDENSFQSTINVLKTRAKPLDIEIQIGSLDDAADIDCYGIFIQYPGSDGLIQDYKKVVESIHTKKGVAVFATDLLALTLITPPGEMGADIVIGSSQRFGVPLGCGGPHAAFMSVREDLKRSLPGRIVGASVDSAGDLAYRLALQTREQHIRREKATSNICTAQALLAIMAGFYALYHGKEGLIEIAEKVNGLILFGGYVRGRLMRNSEESKILHETAQSLIAAGWGSNNPAFRTFFTSSFIPDATVQQASSFDELQRVSTSAKNGARIQQMNATVDVRELAKQLKIPCLVLHCEGDQITPHDEGRRMAALIPGSQFVTLEGNNHALIENTPAFDKFVLEVTNFVKGLS